MLTSHSINSQPETTNQVPTVSTFDQPAKRNKYCYLFVLQGNYGYGHGFEDLAASEDRREVRENLKEYRANEGGNYRIIRRRELNV